MKKAAVQERVTVVLYRQVHCPLCNEQHDLWMEESGVGLAFRPHEFLCPKAQRRIAWHPDVFAHLVEQPPKGAVQLVPIHYAETVR